MSERFTNAIGKGSILCSSAEMADTELISVDQKSKPAYCVFNKTRESFLSLNVAAADTPLTRLKGLLGKIRLKTDEGIWVIPSRGVHTIGVPFAIDLIYLDSDYSVIHLTESFGSFRIGPVRRHCASILELPPRTIYSSQTRVGDELLICLPEEMEQYLHESEGKTSFRNSSDAVDADRNAG